jgi:putative membrane protein
MTTTLAYLHFIGVIALAMLLAVEYAVLRQPLDDRNLAFIRTVDGFYGLAALAVVASGIARIFYEKGWPYYAGSGLFWAKMALVTIAGVVSLRPTIAFIRARHAGAPEVADLGRLRRAVYAQLILLPPVPLLAVLMARGFY